MQTLALNLEQKQEHVSLPIGSTSLESSEAIKPEALSSSISGEEIIPYDIRPLTPEVTYPYPLYNKFHKIYKIIRSISIKGFQGCAAVINNNLS